MRDKRQRAEVRHREIAAAFVRERDALRSDPVAVYHSVDALAAERVAASVHVSVRTVRRIVARQCPEPISVSDNMRSDR